jgi:hypothetical protein
MEKWVEIAYSVNGVPIRLTYERWCHIVENHDELASHFYEVLEVVERPDFVTRRNKGSLKAARRMGKRNWLIVICRELSKHDGFVITAYLLGTKPKGEVVWRQ